MRVKRRTTYACCGASPDAGGVPVHDSSCMSALLDVSNEELSDAEARVAQQENARVCRHLAGVGGRQRIWHKRRSSTDARTRRLHELLDRVLAAGLAPVEIESRLVELLELARRRESRDR
jgi:hypothetical protein